MQLAKAETRCLPWNGCSFYREYPHALAVFSWVMPGISETQLFISIIAMKSEVGGMIGTRSLAPWKRGPISLYGLERPCWNGWLRKRYLSLDDPRCAPGRQKLFCIETCSFPRNASVVVIWNILFITFIHCMIICLPCGLIEGYMVLSFQWQFCCCCCFCLLSQFNYSKLHLTLVSYSTEIIQ